MLGVAGALFSVVLPLRASARAEPLELTWNDLVPEGSGGTEMDRLREMGIVQHGQLSTPFDQERGGRLTQAYDGQRVRLPGYMVPLDFSGRGVSTFLLVPYVGACIHVPPPPPNQLVFVTAEKPYDSDGLFEAVYVTGIFGAAATETELADVGYAITKARVEPYQ
jgi:hypothetical protein